MNDAYLAGLFDGEGCVTYSNKRVLRKGKKTARLPKKKSWMARIRSQRKFIKELKEKKILKNKVISELRSKAKGGFFRSKRHIKITIEKIKK